MSEQYHKNLFISPSLSDSEGKLSYPAVFTIFMDLASEHAELLGFGLSAMAKKNLFWLTVKTKIKFFRRPKMTETVTARTWLEPPEKIRCSRNYALESRGEILVAGKTEWAVMNTVSGTLVPIHLVYPENFQYEKAPVFSDHFARIADSFDSAETVDEYRVRSTDIDVGGHMNNAAYLRVLFGSLSCAEVQAWEISNIDVVFRKSVYEGDVLTLERKNTKNGLLYRYSFRNETVFLASIE